MIFIKFFKFHDISRFSRCTLIFPGFPGFPGRVGTLTVTISGYLLSDFVQHIWIVISEPELYIYVSTTLAILQVQTIKSRWSSHLMNKYVNVRQ